MLHMQRVIVRARGDSYLSDFAPFPASEIGQLASSPSSALTDAGQTARQTYGHVLYELATTS